MTGSGKGAESNSNGTDSHAKDSHAKNEVDKPLSYAELPAQREDWQIINRIGQPSYPEQFGFGYLTLQSGENNLAARSGHDDKIGTRADGQGVNKPDTRPVENYREVTGESLLKNISYTLVDGKDVAAERNKLVNGLEKGFGDTPMERDRAKIFMGNFEERMLSMEQAYRKQGLDQEQAHKKVQEEVRETYKQVNRILDKNEPSLVGLSEKEREMLAKQILSNACNTNDIGQGGHKTCNVAAVEVRTYAQDPAAAARLVADVALTGKYTTRDGHEIKINKGSLTPHDEAKTDPPMSGGRNFANQIFQVAAVNVYYQRHGDKRYEQREPSGKDGDTGERLVDYSVNPPKEGPTWFDKLTSQDFDFFYNSPNLGGPAIVDIGNQITDNKGKSWYFAQKDNAGGDVPTVSSQEDLLRQLENAANSGQLPVVLRVNTRNEPFWTDSGAGKAGGSGGWHVVTVTDFAGGSPPKIMVDNQWDRNSDHDSKSSAIDLPTLYRAMQMPEQNAVAKKT